MASWIMSDRTWCDDDVKYCGGKKKYDLCKPDHSKLRLGFWPWLLWYWASDLNLLMTSVTSPWITQIRDSKKSRCCRLQWPLCTWAAEPFLSFGQRYCWENNLGRIMEELLPGIRYQWGENKSVHGWEPCNLRSGCPCHSADDAVVSVRKLHEIC